MVDAVQLSDLTRARDARGRRVMIVSARIGGGHDATGRALVEVVRERWPGSEIHWVDTLDAMGPGVGSAFCWIYTMSVERAPWLYDAFYGATWRFRWFSHASKRFTGSWSGRRIARAVDEFVPEVVLSTYPLGSAGLAWLRRFRGLAVPTIAWVSDFAPHPFWVYADIDVSVVAHESAVAAARLAEPGAVVRAAALPVLKAFRPGDTAAARSRFGLRPDAFVVLMSCGTFAFGVNEAMVRTILATDERIQLVVACGRNAEALTRLERLGHDRTRLLPLAWTDDMAALNQAADVILTNAGGATALEAVACDRPILMVEPIPAHGAANASLMAVAGLADMCTSAAQLPERLRGLLEDNALAHSRGAGARAALLARDLGSDLAAVTSPGGRRAVRPTRPWPMRPPDAFFAQIERGGVPQEIGVVLDLGPRVDGGMLTVTELRDLMAERIARVPPLQWQPVRRGHRWGWLACEVDVAAHIDGRMVTSASDASAVVDEFWSTPLRHDRPPWQMRLVQTVDGCLHLLVKVHHCLGDGLSALGLLDRLLDAEEVGRQGTTSVAPGTAGLSGPSGAGGTAVAASASRRRAPIDALMGAALATRGLWRLAARGGAPRHPLNSPLSTPDRAVVLVPLPTGELRLAARRRGVRTFELALGIVAEALDRLLRPAGLVTEGLPLRAFVPLNVTKEDGGRISGNRVTAIPVDLPMGSMSPAARLKILRTGLHDGLRCGEPAAASLVLRMTGLLPGGAHAWFSRRAYSHQFLNLVVSYVPGPRGRRWLAGAPVRAIYPVAPLNRRVPLSVGLITTDTTTGVGILLDPMLGLDAETVSKTMVSVYGDLLGV